MGKYTIGIDYGSLSGRALIINAITGEEIASSVLEYPHAVMTKGIFDYALQDPQDYLDVLKVTIPKILEKSGVLPKEVVGLGIDFTACTLLPIKKDGTPLCFLEEYKNNNHAYVKLWKHHAAQKYADRLNEISQKRNEPFMEKYGHKVSSETLVPKVMQIVEEAEEIYEAADLFIEAGDWIVMMLTGELTRNGCAAGYKALYSKEAELKTGFGYPSKEFFKELNPKLENFIEDKLYGNVIPIGSLAGEVNEVGASLTNLKIGTKVAVSNIDAHVTAPAAQITEAGSMLMIIGTSTCHMLLSDINKDVEGIFGVVEDGILPGFYGYESGQSCVGDHFEWFVNNNVPYSYVQEAKELGVSIFKLLKDKGKKLKPGESGLVALDWWNGNRSILVDVDLTGLILGMNLQTKPEDIYIALIEATAYGTRTIIENYRENGIAVEKLYAAGGISQKDELFMQIYADIIGMEIFVADSTQAPALGSAIFGAVAAGIYDDIFEGAKKLGRVKEKSFIPNLKNKKIYDKLFSEYKLLHDYFGRNGNNVMKRLKEIKKGEN